jgi:hypothetical protein
MGKDSSQAVKQRNLYRNLWSLFGKTCGIKYLRVVDMEAFVESDHCPRSCNHKVVESRTTTSLGTIFGICG